MMSLREVFKMVLPLVVTTLAIDMVDGFPEQTIIFLIELARWIK
jgi:hypothetical protein